MLIKELRRIIKDLPADADIVMQKRVNQGTVVAPVLTTRISIVLNKDKELCKRLVLMNMKPLKMKGDTLWKTQHTESGHGMP